MPNLAIAAKLREKFKDHPHKLNLLYIGSKNRMDGELVKREGIQFKGIFTGKLRRYFSFQNFIDAFKIPLGFIQSFYFVYKFNPDVIFSKGGYVAFPVALAGWVLRKKIITHESDATVGLANKLTSFFADQILVSYEETIKRFPRRRRKKIKYTGLPIREEMYKGTKKAGYKLTGFTPSKPVVLIMGGSLGAMKINDVTWSSLTRLIPGTQVVHICGKGKSAKAFSNFLLDKLRENYLEFEYVGKELADIYAITDLMVSRAGANSLAEIEALRVPAIIIPLPGKYSRGDQYENAIVFKKKDKKRYKIIKDKKLNSNLLISSIRDLLKYQKRPGKTETHFKPTEEVIKILLNEDRSKR